MFSVPGQITAVLPAADRRHERVAEVVFAMGGLLDITPFEGVAATASHG